MIVFYFVRDLVANNGEYGFVLGTQESSVWDDRTSLIGGSLSILYNSGDKKLTVLLECSRSGSEFEALGEGETNNYKFRLQDKCACFDGCSGE